MSMQQLTREQIDAKVKDILVEQLGVDEDEVTRDTSIVDDLGADSLDLVEIVMAIEEEFGLEIPDEEAENVKTALDAMNLTAKHVEAKAAKKRR